MRAKILPTESAEQQAVIKWWAAYSRTVKIDERLLMSIPNGSVLAGGPARRAMQSARLKREGMRPGAPDLLLAMPKYFGNRMLFAALFIEMKRADGGKVSEAQLKMADLLRRAGYNAVIVAGVDAAIAAIKGYLNA